MSPFTAAQAAHFRDADFLNPGLAEFQHVIATVVTSIRGQFLRFYPHSGFCLSQYRKQFGPIAGVAPVNLVVNDDSTTVLHQLQRAPKLHRLIEFPFANRPHHRVVEGNDPLRDRFLSRKLLLGLV